MKSNDKTAQALARITELERDEASEPHGLELVALLGHRSNHVVGAAATLIGDWEVEAAIPELEIAFYRFMENPVKSDPMCVAKRAIVETLTKLNCANTDLFLIALRHIQLEPMWGDPEDTAPGLRGLGGRALVSMHYPEAILVHADLLMDSEVETRRIAVDTLTELGSNEAELLLRITAQAFPQNVTAECLAGLMKIHPERSLEFVAHFLHDSPEIMEGAALAIGESHHPDAFSTLKKCWHTLNDVTSQSALLLPMALTRHDEAFILLGHIVQESSLPLALSALEALALFATTPEHIQQIRDYGAARDEARFQAALNEILA